MPNYKLYQKTDLKVKNKKMCIFMRAAHENIEYHSIAKILQLKVTIVIR